MTWLALTHSPDKVLAWMRRDEGSERHYASQFRMVFGLPLEEAWQQWIAFEHDFQQANLAQIRKHPITSHRKLVDRPLGSMSRVYFDEATGVLYGGFRMPGVSDHIGAVDTRDGSTAPAGRKSSGRCSTRSRRLRSTRPAALRSTPTTTSPCAT